ncbi:MAG: fused response regulator/phosphatase [Pseudomonadales bacterium]|nr:fused response regulator/phosphatase [Pseudomonadales bacterium]
MKILVVDDQAANRGLLTYLLEEDGHEVIAACDGYQGVEKFDSMVPDLVLMDVMMPGMDGYETAERIKARLDKYVPIIFLTALSDDMSLSRCIESGGDDFLTKPVNETLLTAKIKAHERIRELNSELSKKNEELEKLYNLFKQEHELAEYVFEAAISGQKDNENVKKFLSPMGGFSGDLILVSHTNRNSLFIMLGDFTGHGLPAALGALPITQTFETLARQGASLGDLARQLNQTLYTYLPGNMFCAANIIELNAQGSNASCWMGGLPDMFVVNSQGNIGQVLSSGHMPLGVLSSKSFKSDIVDVKLEPGERLITYSDGVTDCCDVNGEMLGEPRFEQMFDGKVKGDALFDYLVDQIQAFGKGRPQDDDVSMLEVVARPIGKNTAEKQPVNMLPWQLSTRLEISSHREMDLVARLLNLFANRAWVRARKDKIHQIIKSQYHYVVDQLLLKVDWSHLGLVEENAERAAERSNRLDKLADAQIYVMIMGEPAQAEFKICLASRKIPAELDLSALDPDPFSAMDILKASSADEGHCIVLELPFY